MAVPKGYKFLNRKRPKPFTEEHRKHLSEGISRAVSEGKRSTSFSKGHAPWNKDKPWEEMKGDNNPSKRAEVKEKISKFHKGKKLSPEHKRIAIKTLTDYVKAHKPKGFTGHHTQEAKDKIRAWHVKHPNLKFKNTSIEIKVAEELKKRNLEFKQNFPLCKVAIVDFLLPDKNIVIECDGDYWHRRPGIPEKDKMKTEILTANGYKVYRFWQTDINKSVEACINQIAL